MRRRALIAAAVAACLCLAGAAEASAQNQAPNQDYVAMGDSYSSGNGTGDYYESTCYRSNLAYGPLINPQIPGTFSHPACSGAQTEDFTTNSQNGFPPQNTLLGNNTDYVTFTIGGNDAGFTDALTACANPFGDCSGALDGAEDFILNDLPGILDSTYAAVRNAAPNAVVTVLGYPRIFRPNQTCTLVYSASEVNRANVIADELSDVIRSRVQAAGPGFAYADARTAWLGHGACDSANWINGLDLGDVAGSFHPTTAGYAAYGGMAASTLLAQRKIGQSIGPNARIAFTSDRDGNAEIYAVNGNGAFPVDLTNNGAADVDPAYSPDGTKLAFASNRDGDYEIYVANSDGSGVTQLTSNAAEDREPDWSPNGELLAFRSNRDGNAEIYKMASADGGSPKRLTNNAAADSAPDWSPDGSEIAFERAADVYRMNSDGQGQVNLTANAASDGDPAWAADGNSIAFESNRDGDYEIFTIGRGTPSGGGALLQRTTNGADDRDPAYSPDGQRLTFTSTRDGNAEIYTATATGGSQARLAANPAADSAPSWQGDQSPPETAIDSGPSGPTPLTTPSFTFSANEPGSSFECRIDGGGWSPCASPHTTAPLAVGPHTFYVRATDPSGNLDQSPASRGFSVTPPPATTAITAGPTGTTGDDTPSFEFDSSDPLSTFECKIDGGAYAPCTSPHTLAHLDDGPHTFTVRGTDSNNNTDPDPPSATFTVDTTAPETTIDITPPTPTNEPRPSFGFSASEPSATFECRFDAGAWASCSSPHQPAADLDDGPHTFEVRATDAALNADPSPAQASFTVDTTAPQTTITSPAPSAADNTPSFEFTSDEPGSSFECRIDGAGFAPCDSPLTADQLADGDHRFEVRATDAAGNADPSPAGLDFTTDATAPETTIDSGPGRANPGETIADGTPTWTFSSDDVAASFECRIDSGSWLACDQSFTAPPLPDGPHTFAVRATDAALNTDQTPAAVSFTIDTTAPTTTIDSAPAATTNDSTPSFQFHSPSDNDASFECRIDGDGWSPCSSPHTAAALPDGPHTFAARATDQVGNTAASPTTRNFSVDTAPPSTAITAPVPAHTNDRTPTFSFDSPSDNDASFECRIDGGGWSPCSSPHTAAELADGDHSFAVRAIDQAANADPSPAEATFNVDTVAPETTITAAPASPGNDSTPRFAFSSDEPGGFECSVDAGPFAPCSSPHELAALPAGQHSFEVRAIDQAANADQSPERRTFVVDTTAPETAITSGPAGSSRSRSAAFNFASSEPGSSFACSLDGAPFSPCSGTVSYDDLADGPHRFAVRATDQAGNPDPTPATREFTVDGGVRDLVVKAKRKQRIRRGRVRVRLTVSAGEPVTVAVTGKLKAGRARVALKPVRTGVEPGATVKLRLATSRRGTAKLKRALAAGGKAKARIAVTATDGAGNAGAARIRVRLR